jgi:pimeloyl-ACP methyl ester carboxylesterase
MMSSAEPVARFYESQGLRLHYTDWGNDGAPSLILLHGGRDHSRNWDVIGRALQPHFHVTAPDLRGHGDSEWAKGSCYSLSDHVYDLTHLIGPDRRTILVGHSYGGMISMLYAGTFPERVSRLAVLDGAFLPSDVSLPIDVRMARWFAQLDRVAASKIRRFATIDEVAGRMALHNQRLTDEQALHLATYAVRENGDGTYSWKYDPLQALRAPYGLSAEECFTLWSRITCPTLLMYGSDGLIPEAVQANVLRHFKHAERKIINDAAHWLQHDKPDEVIAALKLFLGVRE